MDDKAIAIANLSEQRLLAARDEAKELIAQFIDPVTAKEFTDRLRAVRTYMTRRGDSVNRQNIIAEAILWGDRKVGELTAEIPREERKGAGRPTIGVHREPQLSTPLQSAGIESNLRKRCEQIAAIPEPKFKEYIQERVQRVEELTQAGALRIARVLKREHLREETADLAKETVAPKGQYRTIVIDPPWAGADSGDADPIDRGNPNYSPMTIEEVAEQPVRELMEPSDCHVYLWVTNRMLPKAYSLFDGWGIRYITTLTWCKPSIGVGRYYRNNTEHAIFGMVGTRLLAKADVGTWFTAERQGKHSTKPVEFYQMVEECSPGPRLEMFARGKRDGWSVWGAEANG